MPCGNAALNRNGANVDLVINDVPDGTAASKLYIKLTKNAYDKFFTTAEPTAIRTLDQKGEVITFKLSEALVAGLNGVFLNAANQNGQIKPNVLQIANQTSGQVIGLAGVQQNAGAAINFRKVGAVKNQLYSTIQFGSMDFVYDEGNAEGTAPFDANNTKGVQEALAANPGAFNVADPGAIDKWYGFDGTKNKITITNKSLTTDDNVTVRTDTTMVNQVKSQLYFDNAIGVTAAADTAGMPVNPFANTPLWAAHGQNVLAEYASFLTPSITFPVARTLNAMNPTEKVVYVNITGDPEGAVDYINTNSRSTVNVNITANP